MPQTFDKAATDIINEMDLRDRAIMANLSEDDLESLQLSLGIYIKQQLEIWSINEPLKESCIKTCRDENPDEDNPAMVIVKRLWDHLKEKYKLRVVE